MNLAVEEHVKIDKIGASDRNSNSPFLKNDFLKIFKDFFKMKLITQMMKLITGARQ